MKFMIVLYLVIVMFFTFLTPYTTYMGGGTNGGVTITNVSQFEAQTQAQGQKLQTLKFSPLGFLSLVKAQGAKMFHTIVLMSFFQFRMGSEAPGAVTTFISALFGLMSLLFIFSVISEMLKYIPGFH